MSATFNFRKIQFSVEWLKRHFPWLVKQCTLAKKQKWQLNSTVHLKIRLWNTKSRVKIGKSQPTLLSFNFSSIHDIHSRKTLSLREYWLDAPNRSVYFSLTSNIQGTLFRKSFIISVIMVILTTNRYSVKMLTSINYFLLNPDTINEIFIHWTQDQSPTECNTSASYLDLLISIGRTVNFAFLFTTNIHKSFLEIFKFHISNFLVTRAISHIAFLSHS